MRRIDKMSNEDVLEFYADARCDSCPLVKTNCSLGCINKKSKYLLSEIKTKKRFQTYENMSDAQKEFRLMCEKSGSCDRCRFFKPAMKHSCFILWLDEEIEVKDDDI